MEFEAILQLLMEQATIWAPSLTAVIAVIVSVCSALSKIKTGLKDINTTNEQLKQSKDFKRLHEDLKQAHLDNIELKKLINLYIDKSTGVKNYVDSKEIEHGKERENKELK